MTLIGPISFSRCGVSPIWVTLRHDLHADAVQEAQTLVADCNGFDAFARGFQLAGLLRHLAQHVGVHAAAQTLVGRDDDEADGFRLHVLGLRHERRACTPGSQWRGWP
jgi:hypothetical protein